MPGERGRPRGNEAAERLVIAGRQILLQAARQLRRLLPAGACVLNRLVEMLRRIRGPALVRQQPFELANHLVARFCLLLELQRIAVLVALEEAIARFAEALPDDLRLRLPHRADRLPLRLQLLERGGGRVPVG